MSNDFCIGLLLGLFSGAAYIYLFVITRPRRRRAANEAMRRHLRELEADIAEGKVP